MHWQYRYPLQKTNHMGKNTSPWKKHGFMYLYCGFATPGRCSIQLERVLRAPVSRQSATRNNASKQDVATQCIQGAVRCMDEYSENSDNTLYDTLVLTNENEGKMIFSQSPLWSLAERPVKILLALLVPNKTPSNTTTCFKMPGILRQLRLVTMLVSAHQIWSPLLHPHTCLPSVEIVFKARRSWRLLAWDLTPTTIINWQLHPPVAIASVGVSHGPGADMALRFHLKREWHCKPWA